MNDYLKFKGGMTTVTTIVVQAAILDKAKESIESFQAKAPALFKGMPVVIDFNDIDIQQDFVAELINVVRSTGAIPFGIKGQSEHLGTVASLCNLAYLGNNTSKGKVLNSEGESKEEVEAAALPEVNETKVVDGQVRGGQQVYARNADLIIIGNVNNGAEVLADGNIHIYGSLKGRALAGLRGDDNAKIFVNNFDPEMVVVNGDYTVKDDIPKELIGTAVIVSKNEEKISINPMPN